MPTKALSNLSCTAKKHVNASASTDLGSRLSAWEEELQGDPDRDFIINGLVNGFDIIDPGTVPSKAHCPNHPSAKPGSPLYEKACEQIQKEIDMGHYEILSEPPTIISPIGVIPKPDGGIRLIHDCSRPSGQAVNDYCTTEWKQKFSTVDEAASLITKGCFMAKVDLKSAYRSVSLSDLSKSVTGLRWQFGNRTVFLRDTRLPFGSKLAPGIFHRLSQAVKRMLKRRGLAGVVVYLDDFFIMAETFHECMEALNETIALLRKLGFSINWNKVVDPSTTITFLGIEIDSMAMCLRLPEDKLVQVREELARFQGRKRASKKQLQSLAGKLNFCASVVYGGRVFSRRIIDTINMLKAAHHKIRLSGNIKADISWWQSFMATFNGRSMLLDHQPITSVFTDSCDMAAGGIYNGDWFYLNWELDWPFVANLHINSKEVLAVFLSVCRWAPCWRNKRICIQSDNSVTVAAINRGTSKNPFLMACLRVMFWLSATYNFHIKARHIRGISNFLADAVSRLHEPGKYMLVSPFLSPSPPDGHLSYKSLSFLLNRSHGQMEDYRILGQ